jgi:hypothetical protein
MPAARLPDLPRAAWPSWFDTQDGYRYVRCHVCEMMYVPEFLPLEIWDEYFGGLPNRRSTCGASWKASVTDHAVVRDRARSAGICRRSRSRAQSCQARAARHRQLPRARRFRSPPSTG